MTLTSQLGTMSTVGDIRYKFRNLYEQSLRERREGQMLEIYGVNFYASDDHIFGAPNHDYIKREMEWYFNGSRNVNDIPGGPPKIWKQVADEDGIINSNYGHLLFSAENGYQYDNVLDKLFKDIDTRQAVAVYTRPSIHDDAVENGRSDFICTNTVQYIHRNDQLHAIVNMRSNDAIFGYRNDYAWQRHVLDLAAKELDLSAGKLIWQVGSLHIYPRHIHLVQHFLETGKHNEEL